MGDRAYFEAWLQKIEHDLRAAKLCGENPDPIYDVAVFHCQQAAEKSVKAYLILLDIEFEKTHDIAALLDLITDKDATLDLLRPDAEMLSLFAVKPRYPDDALKYQKTDYDKALAAAVRFVDFIRQK